ncbi:MAG: hypothetical protein ACREOF_01515 [Gemmatimonadales bacterium]
MSQTTIQQARFRRVEAEVLLPAGWLDGTFVVPETQSLQDFLEHSGAFLKLTDARVPGHEEVVPFFAVQRGAVELIAPKIVDDRVETGGARATPRRGASPACSIAGRYTAASIS